MLHVCLCLLTPSQVSEYYSSSSTGANEEILGATNREPGNRLEHNAIGEQCVCQAEPSAQRGVGARKSVANTKNRNGSNAPRQQVCQVEI